MPKHKYVVRVVVPRALMANCLGLMATLLECLRYAHLVHMHRDDDEGVCFDLLPPDSISDTSQWAQMNAERMSTFGWNAVRAPAWPAPAKEVGDASL
jgi:hypothetical protein